MQTKLPTAWSEPNFSTSLSDPTSQPSASMVNNPTVCLHGPKSTFNSRLHGRELNSLCHNGRDKIVSCLAHNQLQTDSFSKYSNSRDHRFLVWHHSHSSPFPIWGLLWQLWLSYTLHTSTKLYPMLCTWTKSQIVQSPTKLNDKI